MWRGHFVDCDDGGVLEMRAECERCQRRLPPDSDDARICSYECTFCAACADELGACPNCGGVLRVRPSRRLTG